MTDEATLAARIREALRRRIGEVAQEETVAAQKRIAERIGQELDKLAVLLLAQYDIRTSHNRIIIEVRKP